MTETSIRKLPASLHHLAHLSMLIFLLADPHFVSSQTDPVINGLDKLNMEWVTSASCGRVTRWRSTVVGLRLRIEAEGSGGNCEPVAAELLVYDIDLTDLSISNVENAARESGNKYRGLYYDPGLNQPVFKAFYLLYQTMVYTDETIINRLGGSAITPVIKFDDASTQLKFSQAVLDVVRQLKNLPPGNFSSAAGISMAGGPSDHQLTYRGKRSNFIAALLSHPSVAGTFSFYNCTPTSIRQIRPPLFPYNSFSKVDKKIRLSALYAYAAELFSRCSYATNSPTYLSWANEYAGFAYWLFEEALRESATQGPPIATIDIIAGVCNTLGLAGCPQPLESVSVKTTTPRRGNAPTQQSGNAKTWSNNPDTGGTKRTASRTDSIQVKAKQKVLTKSAKPSDVKREMEALKAQSIATTTARIATQPTTDKKCSDLSIQIPLAGTPLSSERSLNSFNGEVPWSEWVDIPHTDLSIRYSSRKDCYPLEVISNSVPDMMQMAFDYGFFQLRNNGPYTASFKFNYQSRMEDATVYEGSEPGFFEPGQTAEESPGNWFMGCDLLTVAVEDYCISEKP